MLIMDIKKDWILEKNMDLLFSKTYEVEYWYRPDGDDSTNGYVKVKAKSEEEAIEIASTIKILEREVPRDAKHFNIYKIL